MIERFSTVVLTEDLPDDELISGDSGTVIDIYDGGTAYEIEFFALSGETVAVATVESKMVRSATKEDVTHSRVTS
jgi:hypothetical protein